MAFLNPGFCTAMKSMVLCETCRLTRRHACPEFRAECGGSLPCGMSGNIPHQEVFLHGRISRSHSLSPAILSGISRHCSLILFLLSLTATNDGMSLSMIFHSFWTLMAAICRRAASSILPPRVSQAYRTDGCSDPQGCSYSFNITSGFQPEISLTRWTVSAASLISGSAQWLQSVRSADVHQQNP